MDMALAATFALRCWRGGAGSESGKKRSSQCFYSLWLWVLLAKGPVAPLLAALVIRVYCAAARGVSRQFCELSGCLESHFSARSPCPGILPFSCETPSFFRVLFCNIILPAFPAICITTASRSGTTCPVTSLALVPWTVFIIAACAPAIRSCLRSQTSEGGRKPNFRIFAFCWLLVPVLFFSISQSKLPGYILPAVPAGAIILADYLREWQESKPPKNPSKWLIVLHAVLASAPFVPALLLAYIVTQHRMPGGRPMLIALALAFILAAGIALTLSSRAGLRMLRFVTLIPVLLSVAAVLKIGAPSLDQELSARPLAGEIASIEVHPLPLAVYGVPREMEYGLNFYRNQPIPRYEWGGIPAQEHFLIAPDNWQAGVAKYAAGRRVLLLGHYAPQRVDYYWVSAATGGAAHPAAQ